MSTLKYIIATVLLAIISRSGNAQTDLRLWYDKPAEKWVEALPVGNGRIGAMIFGGVEQDRIQFNEETLWTGEPRSYSRPGAYKYLDSLRQLLFAGKQKEAEALALKEFMGLKSNEGSKDEWVKNVVSLKGLDGNPSLENFDDSKWKMMTVPSYEGWEAVGHDGLDGSVWLRTSFELPSSWQGKDLILDLNRIRDQDRSYVNGKLVGGQSDTEPRKYLISKEVLHAGKNTISVQVLNFFDKGGITGFKDTTRHIGVYPLGNETAKISLNGSWKYFVQNDNPPPVGVYQASYQPFGDLYMQFPGNSEISNYKRSLDISNAIATTSYTSNGIDFKREYLISQPDQVMAIQLSASRKSSIDVDLTLASAHKDYVVKKIDNKTISLFVQVRNGALHGDSYLHANISGGSIQIVDNRIVIRAANEATIYLSASTNFKNYHDVTADSRAVSEKSINSVKQKTYTAIKAAHIREYQKYFNTFFIDLGKSDVEQLSIDERLRRFATSNDPSFVALYVQYGRYLLISSSRPGTRPANLQGIWNDLITPPWGSKYTTNINVEMNYWPAEMLNLSAMHQPLIQMIKELSVTGQQTAKDHYNAPGWVLHHNTDLWRGTAPINASNHGTWVTGGAWLCQHLWEHYLFTQDKVFLKDTAYPIMKSAAAFFNSYLIKDPVSGFLISSPSNSPEQGGMVAGPTMDHQIIRDLFKNVIEAERILGIHSELSGSLKIKYSKIAPNKIGRYGQLQEWMKDVDDTSNKHRHISHFWGMYPGNEINWDDSPELMKAARQSLIYRGDAATGWSLGWKINCWARFKDGDHSFQLLQMLLSPVKNSGGSYPNLFDAHPPFQIDGNFGGAAGIGEMLVQSHTKYLDILPALPSSLPNGKVKGICARGGFELDLQWQNGKLQQLVIRSKAGSPLMLRYNDKVISIQTTKNGVYRFDGSLKKI